jgi:hypothetical protein
MKKTIWLVLGFSIAIVAGACNDKAGPTPPSKASADSADPKRAAINNAIAKTSPEGKALIEKAKGMKALVNGDTSSKTLTEMIDDYSKNKGDYNITPIGWEAAQKKTMRWKLIFHYQEFSKEYSTAEWEYNPDNNTIYPFDTKNSVLFYAPSEKGKKGK